MDCLFLIIPAYNESENIEKLIDEWYPVVEKHNGGGNSRMVLIDDGSKDQTYPLICQCAADRPLLIPLTKENGGHGAAVLYGYRYALEQKADYIFQTDSDRQTLPEEFEGFWNERKKYDMVIGWRRNREDGLSRVFVTRVLRLVVRIFFKVDVQDANTPYRLMNAETMRKYMDLIPENYHLSNVLLSVIYHKKNCSIKFIPVTFRPRQGGSNSINLKKICRLGWQAAGEFRRLNKRLDQAR